MKLKKDEIDSLPLKICVNRSELITNSSNTLSIEECKKYLGETNLSDKEIEELRDALCSFIDGILDNYFDKLVQ